MRLLVTRPEPDASRTAEALRALGHKVMVAPLLTLRPMPECRLPKRRFQALLLTSANAVRALATHPERDLIADLPVFAVGDATALVARRAGFAANSAGGDVDELASHVAGALSPKAGPLLHLGGEVVANDPTGTLKAAGFRIQSAAIYAMDPVESLPAHIASAFRDGAIDGVLLYSRRTAAVFAIALRRAGLSPLGPDIVLFCLSRSIAEAVTSVASGPIRIAAAPNQLSLFACLQN